MFGGSVIECSVCDHRGCCHSKGVRPQIKSLFSSLEDFRITGTRSADYEYNLRHSNFCLCPEGWHAWTPRPVEAILMGCIPVVISTVELPLSQLIDYGSIVIRWDGSDMEELPTFLRTMPHEQIVARRVAMASIWHRLVYNMPMEENDAVDSILQILARRISANNPGGA